MNSDAHIVHIVWIVALLANQLALNWACVYIYKVYTVSLYF